MRSILCVSMLLVGCAEGPLWEKLETGVEAHLNSIHGVTPMDVWAVGNGGTVLHFDGRTWSKQPSGTSNDLKGVWAASDHDVWLVGSSKTVLRWNGTTISPMPNVPESFTSVLGLDANTVFFCGFYGLYQFSDGAFTEFTKGGNSVNCEQLFKLSDGIGALIGNDVYRLTKSGSTLLVSLPDISSSRSVAVLGPADVWSVGESSGSVLRYGSGSARELVLPKDMNANGAFVHSATDVWVFGVNGYLAHFDGNELTLKVAGDYSAPDLSSMWGVPGVTFAVGSNGWAMRLVED